MAEESTPARETRIELNWWETCSWLILFRAVPIACSLTIVLLALAAAVLSPLGWRVGELVFLSHAEVEGDDGFAGEVHVNRSSYRGVFPDQLTPAQRRVSPAISVLGHDLRGVDLVFWYYVNPIYQSLNLDNGWQRFAYQITGWLWMLLIWSFFATAITRAAVLRFTRGEAIGIREAVRYATTKCLAALTGILLPLIGVLLCLIPLGILGLLFYFNIGWLLLGAIWFIILFFAFLIGLLLLGLLFGWPLIIVSISTEGQDGFDAFSRSFAYTYRRPIHYLFYAIVALLLGGFVWLIVGLFAHGVIHVGVWGTSFGSNRFVETLAVSENREEIARTREIASTMIDWWNGWVLTVAAAWMHGLFWCLATAVYLLLRKDLDQIDLDEVAWSESPDAEELPELTIDEDGIPQIKTDGDAPSEQRPDAENSPPADGSSDPTGPHPGDEGGGPDSDAERDKSD